MLTMTKRRNPTMTRRRRSQVLLETDQQKLIQGFSNLEKEWNSFNSSKPHSDAIAKSLQLLNNSPRSLMSSLQVTVRSNEVAVEEIRRDRKAAIESGLLKGRRLFEEESEMEVGFGEREEVCSETSYDNYYEGKGSCGRSKEEKVCGSCVCCDLALRLSCLSDEEEGGGGVMVEGGEKVVEVNVDQVKRDDEISFVNGAGKWMAVIKGCFLVVLMVAAMVVVFMGCNGGYGVDDEVMLVPT